MVIIGCLLVLNGANHMNKQKVIQIALSEVGYLEKSKKAFQDN